jgi:7-cyano-7-deazaguanine synthase
MIKVKKAVVLLSGGLDSNTCLALAQSNNFSCVALSFSYGQRHASELVAARRIAQSMSVAEHKIINIDTQLFAGSALTDETIAVPQFSERTEIPVTYVPARNTIFLSLALGLAESIGARDLFIGASSIDYSHYPDCRPEFISAFQVLANLATKATSTDEPYIIHAPLQYMSKAETIQLGHRLGVDYRLTVSCYQANDEGEACGHCDSCTFRKKGFLGAQLADPTLYVSSMV